MDLKKELIKKGVLHRQWYDERIEKLLMKKWKKEIVVTALAYRSMTTVNALAVGGMMGILSRLTPEAMEAFDRKQEIKRQEQLLSLVEETTALQNKFLWKLFHRVPSKEGILYLIMKINGEADELSKSYPPLIKDYIVVTK